MVTMAVVVNNTRARHVVSAGSLTHSRATLVIIALLRYPGWFTSDGTAVRY